MLLLAHGFYHSTNKLTGDKLNAPQCCRLSYLTTDHCYIRGHFQSEPILKLSTKNQQNQKCHPQSNWQVRCTKGWFYWFTAIWRSLLSGFHLVINTSYLFTPGEPEPQHLPKLFKVRFELWLRQPDWQVSHIDHPWSQTIPLRENKGVFIYCHFAGSYW